MTIQDPSMTSLSNSTSSVSAPDVASHLPIPSHDRALAPRRVRLHVPTGRTTMTVGQFSRAEAYTGFNAVTDAHLFMDARGPADETSTLTAQSSGQMWIQSTGEHGGIFGIAGKHAVLAARNHVVVAGRGGVHLLTGSRLHDVAPESARGPATCPVSIRGYDENLTHTAGAWAGVGTVLGGGLAALQAGLVAVRENSASRSLFSVGTVLSSASALVGAGTSVAALPGLSGAPVVNAFARAGIVMGSFRRGVSMMSGSGFLAAGLSCNMFGLVDVSAFGGYSAGLGALGPVSVNAVFSASVSAGSQAIAAARTGSFEAIAPAIQIGTVLLNPPNAAVLPNPTRSIELRAATSVDVGSVTGPRRTIVDSASRVEATSKLGTKPFSSMPLRWERSFGGPGFDANPIGTGYRREGDHHLLPNLENPEAVITSPTDRPNPVGAFPIPRGWKIRAGQAGTYDRHYLQTRFPWLAHDFDPAYFNAAPLDQQSEAMWRGDEAITLLNLHPEHSRIETRLPGLAARAFVQRNKTGAPRLEEIALQLDTITVDADQSFIVAVWRGRCEVRDETMSDVDTLFVMHEAASRRSSLDGCHERLGARLLALAEGELFFQGEDVPDHEVSTTELSEFLPSDATRAIPEREPAPTQAWDPVTQSLSSLDAEPTAADPIAKVIEDLKAQGVDFKKVMPNLERGMGSASLAPFDPASAEQIRTAFADLGQTVPPDVEEALAELDPASTASEATREFGETQVLALADARATIAMSHEELPETPEDRSEWIRKAARSGTEISDCDLTGIDLRGVDLSGLKLMRVILHEANFEGAMLAGATFVDCVVTKVRFRGARLRGITLDGSDLSGAEAPGCDLSGASLRGIVATEMDLARATLDGCRLAEAELALANLEGASLKEADCRQADFTEANLTNVDGRKGSFIDARLMGARAPGANFYLADLKRLRASGGADFSGAVFTAAIAVGSRWRDANLANCDFTGADLSGSDFSGANLTAARLTACVLRKAVFQRSQMPAASLLGADVLYGSLRETNLHRADLRRANLYGAELWRANLIDANLEGANLGATKLEER